jgi:hypothetical protein
VHNLAKHPATGTAGNSPPPPDQAHLQTSSHPPAVPATPRRHPGIPADPTRTAGHDSTPRQPLPPGVSPAPARTATHQTRHPARRQRGALQPLCDPRWHIQGQRCRA